MAGLAGHLSCSVQFFKSEASKVILRDLRVSRGQRISNHDMTLHIDSSSQLQSWIPSQDCFNPLTPFTKEQNKIVQTVQALWSYIIDHFWLRTSTAAEKSESTAAWGENKNTFVKMEHRGAAQACRRRIQRFQLQQCRLRLYLCVGQTDVISHQNIYWPRLNFGQHDFMPVQYTYVKGRLSKIGGLGKPPVVTVYHYLEVSFMII